MGGLYAAGALVVVALFVFEILHRREIRTGLLLIAVITATASYGLVRVRSWGRGLGLFVALAMAGLGAVALLGAIASHHEGKVVPAVLLGASMAVGYLLGMSVFTLHDD